MYHIPPEAAAERLIESGWYVFGVPDLDFMLKLVVVNKKRRDKKKRILVPTELFVDGENMVGEDYMFSFGSTGEWSNVRGFVKSEHYEYQNTQSSARVYAFRYRSTPVRTYDCNGAAKEQAGCIQMQMFSGKLTRNTLQTMTQTRQFP